MLPGGKRRPESFHGLMQSSPTDADVSNIKQSAFHPYDELRTAFFLMIATVAGGGDNRFKPS